MTVNIPFVTLEKEDGSLGLPEQADPTGILAILAPRMQGPSAPLGPSTPVPATNRSTILANQGQGLMLEIASYTLPQTKKPVLLVPTDYSTDPLYGTFDYHGTGTLSGSVSGHSGADPVDDINATVLFVTAGTTGTSGITLQYSIDARDFDDPAKVWSAVQSLGTALFFEIPDTGIRFDFITGKTVVAGDYFVCQTTGPRLTDADVLNGLSALGQSSQPWEAVLIEGIDASSTTVANADTFLEDLESRGKYRAFITGARLREQDGSESEAEYLDDMTTTWASVGSIRGSVTADGAIVTSPNRGIDMVRKTTVPYAARLMKLAPGQDAAQVDVGNLAGTRITDPNGNLVYHDEENDPGLNDIRLTTLRRWANRAGVFVTNPLVISTPGSDYVLMQQVRCMNRACEVAYGQLVSEMSKGVFQDLKTSKIREDSAQAIESRVNGAMRDAIGSQVQAVAFGINRDDVLTPPVAVLNGVVEMITLVYIKGFRVKAKLTRSITVSQAA